MNKILYIANARIPTEKAHGLQIMKMCESFTLVGLDVELILPTKINKNFKNIDPFIFYNVLNNFRITKIKTFDPIWLFKFPSGTYIKVQSFLYLVSLFFFLLLRNNKDYIFYTRDEQLLPILLLFSKNVYWEGHNLPRNYRFYLAFWKKCFKLVVITHSLKNGLIKFNVNPEKIIVAPDGVDLKNFEIKESQKDLRQELNLPLDKKIIMYTGHLYEWKGVNTLAEAAKELKEFVFVFVGGTNQDIKNFKEKYLEVENIIIVGQVKHQLIPRYLKSADVLVLPNSAKSKISKFYTSPMKLFEYMAAQRPIVASDLPSIREVLNEANAVFFDPDNSFSLRQAILRVITDQELSQKIAVCAFNDVKAYQWGNRVKRIIDFI